MAYQLIEKKRFVNKLVNLLQYLENEWGYNVAVKFQSNVDKHLALISDQPYIGITTSKQDVRSILITKHNRLFYRISGNKIIILNLYDTRMHPKRNPYKRR
jgi:plasmid stabilization system protein ParE